MREALPADDPQMRCPDISVARDLLGWEPTITLDVGLARTIDTMGVDGLVGVPA